jgi:predicted ATPase
LAVLKDALQDRQLLLVLDNFEQVLAAAPLATELLGAARPLKILVTSRQRLHVYGEHVFPVPPLSLPEIELDSEHEPDLPPVERLLHFEAIRLFSERAGAVRSDFVLTRDNAPFVTAICDRLGGVPLAIELAAAQLRDLPLEAIAGQIAMPVREPGSGALALLVDATNDRLARQQSLRDAIAWSYQLLDPAERALFRRLAVFSGGCAVEAVQAVANLADDPDFDAGAGLVSLLDHGLLTPTGATEAHGPARACSIS